MPLEGDSRRVPGLGSTKVLLGVWERLKSARLGHLGGPEGGGGRGGGSCLHEHNKKGTFFTKIIASFL